MLTWLRYSAVNDNHESTEKEVTHSIDFNDRKDGMGKTQNSGGGFTFLVQ